MPTERRYASRQVAPHRINLPQAGHMSDEAVRFEGEDKIRRYQLKPSSICLVGRHMVEGVVDFRRLKPVRVIGEPLGVWQCGWIEDRLPGAVDPSGSADQDLRHVGRGLGTNGQSRVTGFKRTSKHGRRRLRQGFDAFSFLFRRGAAITKIGAEGAEDLATRRLDRQAPRANEA